MRETEGDDTMSWDKWMLLNCFTHIKNSLLGDGLLSFPSIVAFDFESSSKQFFVFQGWWQPTHGIEDLNEL